MEREENINDKGIIGTIYLIFLFGIIGHAVSVTRTIMLTLTPFTLIAAGILALYKPAKNNKYLLMWCVLTYFITLSLEAIGTNTGIIFGNYSYGRTLGIKIMNVPYIIGFNWVILILGAVSLSYILTGNFFARIFTASCLTVIMDFFLERLAGKLDYWSWAGNSVPVLNYVTWFAVTFLAAATLQLFVKNFNHKNLANFFIGQTIFLIALNLILK